MAHYCGAAIVLSQPNFASIGYPATSGGYLQSVSLHNSQQLERGNIPTPLKLLGRSESDCFAEKSQKCRLEFESVDAKIEIDTLFVEHNPRTYGYAKHSDDEFGYMNRHADPPVLAAREILESWYGHFPVAHRLDLLRRFRSKNHKQHEGAFWELYLHELFRCMGYGVQVHPHLNGRKTRPDFLLIRDGRPFAFVEARLAGLRTDQVTSAERLKKELHDALDEVRSPNFFLEIGEIRTAPTRPTFKRLANLVERWLETLNPDLPIQIFLHDERFEWEHEGWHLSLKVIPKSPDHRGREGTRSVGIMGGDFQWADTRGELRRALAEKAGKYGNLDIPFVIAINHMGVHCDREDWTDVLYGSRAVHVCFNEHGVYSQEPFRKSDGFWVRGSIPRHTHLSALIGGWQINPWSMGAHLLEVYEHFSAERAIDWNGNLPCWYAPTGRSGLEMRLGRSSAEVLGIPKGWPGSWTDRHLSDRNVNKRDQR